MPKTIPNCEIESLARSFLPDILAYFESGEVKQEFKQWQNDKIKMYEKAAVQYCRFFIHHSTISTL